MISDLRLKRAAPLSRAGHLFTPTVGLGGAGSQHRSSARHMRVSTMSQGRAVVDRARGGRRRHRKHLGVAGREGPRPNPLLSRPGRICRRSTVVGAVRQAVRPRRRSTASTGASTSFPARNRRYCRTDDATMTSFSRHLTINWAAVVPSPPAATTD